RADPHLGLVLLDPRYGGAQLDNAVAELARHADRHELRPADEAILLRAALGVEQPLEAAARMAVEEHVEQAEVGGLRRPDRLDAELDERAATARVHVAPQPRPERLAVEPARVRRLPRRVER